MSKSPHVQVIYVPLLENYRRKCAELQHEVDRLSGMQVKRPPAPASDEEAWYYPEDGPVTVCSHHSLRSMCTKLRICPQPSSKCT